MYEIDVNILLWVQEHIRNPYLNIFFKSITHLGDAGIFWILLTVGLLIFKKTRKAGIYSACALILMLIFNNLCFKLLFNRIRPYEVIDKLILIVPKAVDSSFPSGHTAASFASSIAIYKHINKKAGIAFIVLACLIAFSRIYVGIHYPSDVLGGFIVGTFIGMLVNLVGDDLEKKLATRNKDVKHN